MQIKETSTTGKLKDFLSSKKESGMYKASIIRRFEEMFELYPNIKMGELIHYVLKSTGDISDPINWADSNFLKKVESVQRQLLESYSSETNSFDKNDEPIDEDFLNERFKKSPDVYGK